MESAASSSSSATTSSVMALILKKALAEFRDTSLQEVVTRELLLPILKQLYLEFTPYLKYFMIFFVVFIIMFLVTVSTLCMIIFMIV